MTGVAAIAELFAGPGARDYLGEAVTIGVHMRQAAALAEAAGAAAPLVAAALLHDVGHLRDEMNESRGGLGPPGSGASPGSGVSLRASTDSRHGGAGAQWLSQWFGVAVTEPVCLHVAAKRYLCATEPGYFGLLSQESVRTLALQGGPMTPEQAAEFEALPFARDAVAVRRWDDEAKDPAVTPPAFAHFEPLLSGLLKRACLRGLAQGGWPKGACSGQGRA
jgi:predicted HD phosphohydrolase